MSRSRVRDLTEEERILWNLVACTARPLKGKPGVEAEPPRAEEPPAKPAPQTSPLPAQQKPVQPQRLQVHHLDRLTQRKISKGRLPLEARIDLHGLRQDEAHGLLLSFLRRAHASGIRYVLVITGKGRSLASDGVLRRSVPSWFATAPFRDLVSGYEDAARNHGGEGALYVRLRRPLLETGP
jgi:DNA-nicking Smr family endonuclease